VILSNEESIFKNSGPKHRLDVDNNQHALMGVDSIIREIKGKKAYLYRIYDL